MSCYGYISSPFQLSYVSGYIVDSSANACEAVSHDLPSI